ncbi:kinase-like domain-containing protein [Cokeromyces recurvatus]|uniref:kinase-like domain-containing protein n=1 Tax=Cokeromyces recurvatus TaxID=90255 RepID=UPI00221F65B7|nr:kinase-like domain-containing protein [Cokeromyces recurvatus]KAI7898141.1 kinase-like domain-containing protein [Cokeromyces recurvatus]
MSNVSEKTVEKNVHNKDVPIRASYASRLVPRLGPYLLLKTLGVGEFGKVKLGKHFETGQIVAVKLIKKENIDCSAKLDKIRMEIVILKRLNHPYIVKLLTVNETNSHLGIVLEHAEGGELFEYIYRQRYLKEEEACKLFSQLISSVYYMHQQNIVHRDLKLENILLDRHGNIIVTDFGFANQFTKKTGDLMSTSCGSPVYAAPELVMTGKSYSGKGVDIWSCGIILYAMLCGYLPFDDDNQNPNSENIGRLYRYIVANKPKYPKYVSTVAKDLIEKMLNSDPKERCDIETIMNHPWLHRYREQIFRPIEDLEKETIYEKELLLKSIQLSYDLTPDHSSIQDESFPYEPDTCSFISSCSYPKDMYSMNSIVENPHQSDKALVVSKAIHHNTKPTIPETLISLPIKIETSLTGSISFKKQCLIMMKK